MIAANEAVAESLEGRGMPCMFRVHEPPDAMKCEEIQALCHNLGFVKGKKIFAPHELPLLLEKARGTQYEEILNYLVLRSLKQAKYSADNVGHFGLASESYCHFTSPIRRYPDLIVHRILREALGKKHLGEARTKELVSILPDVAFHSSHTERIADEAERSVLAAMRAWFMRDRVGETFAGAVVSVAQFGLKIRLKEFYVEGFLHVSAMADDYYSFDEKSLSLVGTRRKKRYTIGEEILVRLNSVDMAEREIVFGLE
jgi:ribonuclease R